MRLEHLLANNIKCCCKAFGKPDVRSGGIRKLTRKPVLFAGSDVATDQRTPVCLIPRHSMRRNPVPIRPNNKWPHSCCAGSQEIELVSRWKANIDAQSQPSP